MFKSLYKAFNMAVSMFTVIPLPKYEWDEDSARYIMRLYPLIGVIVGFIWYLAYVILKNLNITDMLFSAILLVIPFLLTGFIHLDGFMDVSDALLSRRNKEEKLRILKDSTVGAFSVIALVLLLILQFASIDSLLGKNIDMRILILIPIASRCLSGYAILAKEPISKSYFGELFKRNTKTYEKNILVVIYLIILGIGYLLLGLSSFISLVSIGITGMFLLNNSNKEFGGVNGDVAGYMLVMTEGISLLVLGIL